MKKNNILFTCFALILMLPGIINSQTTHDVTVTNFYFTPAILTITAGDAVRWTNVLGDHNVVADDNSFTSGPVAPAPWEYTYVFTAAGTNPYYCQLHGGPGGIGMSGTIIVQDPVSVPGEEFFAEKFELNQNYPNPFNPSTKINFVLPFESFVSIKVYDIIGNEVAMLVNETKSAGKYDVEFNADKLPSGIYVYQLTAGSFIQSKKMILLR